MFYPKPKVKRNITIEPSLYDSDPDSSDEDEPYIPGINAQESMDKRLMIIQSQGFRNKEGLQCGKLSQLDATRKCQRREAT